MKKLELIRCAWVTDDPLYINYHDNEWGVPTYGEHALFELLILESMQAGLSWITILKKRESYRKCFDEFDPQKIALYNKDKVEALLLNPTIIRHRLKIESIVNNAHAYLQIIKDFGSFSNYLWQFVQGIPILNHWTSIEQVPTHTNISDKLSADLKKHGFKFVGSKTCYAFMQASGMVNDHTINCFCRG
jgi:DNA-3-methyladenine glycosylase I